MSALLGLSFRRTAYGRHQPHVPNNEERLRALRQVMPTQLGNAYPWPYTQSEAYAREQAPQEPITDYAERRGM